MYLKSIEVQGFKSFANKLLFELHNSITGIVGPNGSDKNSVVNAMHWVLGEQRIKQLRGASVQDATSAGIKMRKPQGFAYVATTLDNSDHQLTINYDEAIVSRRLHRSGESEYMINGSSRRLKDINGLLYDTGIGKEGYSVIGRGQIDKILGGKPEERRELFDEAAGIVKLRRRGAIAQKKLEDEQANLVHVSDILSELEKRAGPLERQSRTAREYLQLKDELKICDANLFFMDTEVIGRWLREVEKNYSLLSDDMDDTRKESEHLEVEYEKLEQDLTGLETQISADRETLNRETVPRGSPEGQINALNEQIHTEEMNGEHLSNRRTVITGELEVKKGQLSPHEGEYSLTDAQVSDARERQDTAQRQLDRQDELIRTPDDSVEVAKAVVIQSLSERAFLTVRQQRYETMPKQVNLRRSEVTQKLLKCKGDESAQDELIHKEQTALDQVRELMENKQFLAQETEDVMIEVEEEVRRLTRNQNDTQQEYHMAYIKLESLKNLAERYDGYGNSIRCVMEVRNRVHGIHSAVADIISTE